MPFMGKFVTFDARRPCTQFAPVSSIPDVCRSTGIESCSGPAHPSLLALLPRIIIQSIRYSTHPIKWSHCNVFQQNKLTVNLLPGTAGILSASICGNQAYELFGLAFGSKGRSALIAAFTAVGKFRYGIQEPTLKIFDDMPVTEKVLHLFFDVLPEFPQNGGFALYVDSDTFNPTGVKKSRLERFNYYLHTRAGQHSSGAATSDENDGDECLARFLMPGIAKNMAKLRAKMRGQS
ncbi:uncharacterized protein LOC128723891 [Anopheles nili]|uniref:uncharacterized protein LOC128723891 n=1 Tax=Anopheles nili TaxID=185578 RepID=UPI00237B1A08|nr:uncharacterized protein LOC128723891 [Anopheles nili]